MLKINFAALIVKYGTQLMLSVLAKQNVTLFIKLYYIVNSMLVNTELGQLKYRRLKTLSPLDSYLEISLKFKSVLVYNENLNHLSDVVNRVS